MTRQRYYVVDAFASQLFTGNPAGVCPLDRWLADETMQAIAAENNLSETAFFVPEDDGFRLRWFTPTTEVPLCGHATLASAYVVTTHLRAGLREVRFETLSGALTVRCNGDLFELNLPLYMPKPIDDYPAELERGLGNPPVEVLETAEDRNFYVLLDDEDAVGSLRPDFALLAELHPRGTVVTAPGRSADFVSRYFVPSYGIPEDPVTGSIHAALTPFWSRRLGKSELSARQLSRRGGELHCRVDGERVRVGGTAVEYLEGTIAVP